MICGHAAAGSVLSPVCGSAEGVWGALVLQVVVERTVRPGLVLGVLAAGEQPGCAAPFGFTEGRGRGLP